jgi:hypothetical protein
MFALTCTRGGSAMRGSDLARRLGIVSCRHCGAIYDLTRVGRPPTDAGLP